jgi:hypothetical protein
MKSADSSWSLRGALDPGQPCGGGLREASFLLPANFFGLVHLSAQLEIRPGVMKPVTWACDQELNSDGSITIEVKRPDDPTWRKGI